MSTCLEPQGLSLDERWRYADFIEATDGYAEEIEACAADVEHFADHWAHTFDPKGAVKFPPFNLFRKQREFLRWLAGHEAERAATGHDREVLVVKSREVGATWLCCLYALHGWLFREGYTVGFGSRKLEYVDRIGDPKSIFEKLRLLLQTLPRWLWPKGFSITRHSGECRLLNPANGSTITGEGGDGIGRGGRTSLYVVDEAAFLERPDLVDSSLMTNYALRVDISTPNGPGNPFYRKRFSLPASHVFTYAWRDDPRKDEAWYANMKATHDAVSLAQNIDMDFTASVQGITIPGAWVRAAVDLDLPYSQKCVAGQDIGEEGSNLSVFIPRWGPMIGDPIDWSRTNTTATAWRARDEANNARVKELYYDSVGVGAGVKGTLQSSEKPLGFIARPVNTGDSPTDSVWPDGQTSKEKFANL